MSKVLIVDDDSAGLEIRKLVLERRGHHVLTAGDADLARAEFHAAKPDVVVLDLRLPEAAQGRALIREFRASSSALRIVVLCGNQADVEGREEEAMVNQILTKPVRSELLLNAITGN